MGIRTKKKNEWSTIKTAVATTAVNYYSIIRGICSKTSPMLCEMENCMLSKGSRSSRRTSGKTLVFPEHISPVRYVFRFAENLLLFCLIWSSTVATLWTIRNFRTSLESFEASAPKPTGKNGIGHVTFRYSKRTS